MSPTAPGHVRGGCTTLVAVDPEAPAIASESDPEPDCGPDLDAIGRDLADVETALARLDDGTYWTDEVVGGPIPDELLAERPTARRSPPTGTA